MATNERRCLGASTICTDMDLYLQDNDCNLMEEKSLCSIDSDSAISLEDFHANTGFRLLLHAGGLLMAW
jgi:hypothetical protein